MARMKSSADADVNTTPSVSNLENPLPDDSGPFVSLGSLWGRSAPIRITKIETTKHPKWGERIVFTIDTPHERSLILECAPTQQRLKLLDYWRATRRPIYARIKRIDKHYIFVKGEEFGDEEIPF